MPQDETRCASFAALLSVILFLKGKVFLNYSKLNAIFKAKSRYKLEMMRYNLEDDKLLFDLRVLKKLK
jgi:hypothetical protein